MRILKNTTLFLFISLFFSCASDDSIDINTPDDGDGNGGGDPDPQTEEIVIVNAFPALRFNRPVDLQSPEDNTNRIFVVEQSGLIRTFSNEPDVANMSTFLDIQARVDDSENEMGLLSMVFHPDFENNGFFYVNYTVSRDLSLVSRFQVSSVDANQADASSELILLSIPQPFTNHNGGQLAFGPDGFLYIASGDGGSAGDPQGNAQNRGNLLGAILRIDVNTPSGGLNYSIPSDNPFAGSSDFREEIFAYGLRNPWRMSFDAQNGRLWSGDVGQGRLEEINIIENGVNYGWNILEGTECFQSNDCNQDELRLPVFEYSHDNGDVSITGGYVYRGNQIPELQGRYVYADFVSGRIWSLNAETNGAIDNQLIEDTNFNIASFGTDNNQELYICSFDGSIYRFDTQTTN